MTVTHSTPRADSVHRLLVARGGPELRCSAGLLLVARNKGAAEILSQPSAEKKLKQPSLCLVSVPTSELRAAENFLQKTPWIIKVHLRFYMYQTGCQKNSNSLHTIAHV